MAETMPPATDSGNLAIREHDVSVLQGDAREQIATLADGSAQCVVTSPPYYGLRDYGCDGQIGLESSPAEYVAAMADVFAEVRRVLAHNGTLWLNLGDSYVGSANSGGANGERLAGDGRNRSGDAVRISGLAPKGGRPPKNLLGIPWRVAFALQDDGWILRNAVIWHKPNAMPDSVQDRFSCHYEHVFLFSKSRRYWFDLDAVKVPALGRAGGNTPETRAAHASAVRDQKNGRRYGVNPSSTMATTAFETKNPGDVWTLPPSPFAGAHFATMPPSLAERCIKAACPEGGTVLDPFAGSGTTLMAARRLGRKSIGIELNPDYIEIIRKRVGQTPFEFEALA